MRALAAQATQAEAEAAAAARTQQRAMIAQMRADNDRLLEAIEQQRQRDVAEEAARQGWCAGAAVCCFLHILLYTYIIVYLCYISYVVHLPNNHNRP